jgi:hypothetical protein
MRCRENLCRHRDGRNPMGLEDVFRRNCVAQPNRRLVSRPRPLFGEVQDDRRDKAEGEANNAPYRRQNRED